MADQMHNNFAGQLRTILQRVFLVCTPNEEEEVVEMLIDWLADKSRSEDEQEECSTQENAHAPLSPVRSVMQSPLHSRATTPVDHSGHGMTLSLRSSESPTHSHSGSNSRPVWVPDNNSTACFTCEQPFTVVRRKHHCRSCSHVFCSRCTSNSTVLPQLNYNRPVRVCDCCYATVSANVEEV